MKWPVFPLFPLLAALVVSVPASAKLCGDDVQGQDVPCDCGDIVVSDLVLGDDPVTQSPCPGDGLIVRATGATRGVTVDLHGKTIRGAGSGTGVWVLYGGPGGARVASSGGRASIETFRDGVVAHGIDSLAALDGVTVVQSVRDGVRVETTNYEVTNVEARDSGRDGIAASGNGFRLSASRAFGSGRSGFYVFGNDGMVGLPGAGLLAESGKGDGINVMGMGHRIVDSVANANQEDGLHIYGMRLDLRGCTATRNGDDGIDGMGMDWTVAGNTADDNDGNGLVVWGWQIVDEGGNLGSGNRGLNEGNRVTQCEISGWPCRP